MLPPQSLLLEEKVPSVSEADVVVSRSDNLNVTAALQPTPHQSPTVTASHQREAFGERIVTP